MDLEIIIRCGLLLEAIACLWIGRTAWVEGRGDDLIKRAATPLLASAAAAVIIFGAFAG